jgi:GWxTD domain-containing protein
MRPYTMAVLALTLTAASAFGGGLEKYKDWDHSPQGYFMTGAERSEWKTIATDADAEKFVAGFLAKRDPKFVEEVATRALNADKYLTIGKIKGSHTLRGKVVILFGPPAGMNVADRAGRSSYSNGPAAAAVTNLGTGPSATGADGDTQTFGGQSGAAFKDFTFSFLSKNVPALGSDYSVTIEADVNSGKDRVRDRKKAAELEEKFEAVARASIRQ